MDYVGILIISSLFAAAFLFICVNDGVAVALSIFAAAAAIFTLVHLVVHLINS